jgi:hypothetical protein
MQKLEKSVDIQLKADAEGQVFLSTQIGNGHLGGGNIKFEGTQLKIAKGMLNNFPLHNFGPLRGKTLIVTTTGVDQNPSSNVIPIVHVFTGEGLSKNELFDFNEDADDNSVIVFVIRYTFK